MWLGGLAELDVGFGERPYVWREVVERKTLLIDGHVRGGGVVSWKLEGISGRRRHLDCSDLKGGRIDIGHGLVC